MPLTSRKHRTAQAVRTALLALLLSAAALIAGSSPAFAGAETAVLGANEQLNPGQRLVTSTGIVLVMQSDGNLVEYAPGNRAVWATGTNRAGSVVRMQGDGNLVVIAPGNVAVWSTRTSGNPNATLELQTDGNAVVYAQGHVARWANGVQISTGAGSSFTDRVVQLTNTERARAGCGALRVDARLTAAAQGHTDEMSRRGVLDHKSADGRTFDQRIRAAGYPANSGMAENIARGQTSPEEVVQGWMNSAGHKRNIVNCAYRAIGVGYAANGKYWTQDFGTS